VLSWSYIKIFKLVAPTPPLPSLLPSHPHLALVPSSASFRLLVRFTHCTSCRLLTASPTFVFSPHLTASLSRNYISRTSYIVYRKMTAGNHPINASNDMSQVTGDNGINVDEFTTPVSKPKDDPFFFSPTTRYFRYLRVPVPSYTPP